MAAIHTTKTRVTLCAFECHDSGCNPSFCQVYNVMLCSFITCHLDEVAEATQQLSTRTLTIFFNYVFGSCVMVLRKAFRAHIGI